jgi:hypothetical protein
MGSLVELYPTRGGRVFASHQYDKEARDDGLWPDIVTLDMEHKEVVIIEITSAADLRSLFDEVTERQKHWFTPIRRSLESDRTIDSSWEIRFLGVVRETLVDGANAKFAGATDVHFSALEGAAFSFFGQSANRAFPGDEQAS